MAGSPLCLTINMKQIKDFTANFRGATPKSQGDDLEPQGFTPNFQAFGQKTQNLSLKTQKFDPET